MQLSSPPALGSPPPSPQATPLIPAKRGCLRGNRSTRSIKPSNINLHMGFNLKNVEDTIRAAPSGRRYGFLRTDSSLTPYPQRDDGVDPNLLNERLKAASWVSTTQPKTEADVPVALTPTQMPSRSLRFSSLLYRRFTTLPLESFSARDVGSDEEQRSPSLFLKPPDPSKAELIEGLGTRPQQTFEERRREFYRAEWTISRGIKLSERIHQAGPPIKFDDDIWSYDMSASRSMKDIKDYCRKMNIKILH